MDQSTLLFWPNSSTPLKLESESLERVTSAHKYLIILKINYRVFMNDICVADYLFSTSCKFSNYYRVSVKDNVINRVDGQVRG